MTNDGLTTSLAEGGLQLLGTCAITAEDALDCTGILHLIGPNEPNFWPIFTQSTEYADGAPDPLDRWSRRVLGDIATASGGKPVFPFGKPPYLPFYTWALRSGRFWASPIGFLVHDTAGLFVSLRGAIVLPGRVRASSGKNPCDSCPDQPCRSACPVEAFRKGYDVAACKEHIASTAGADCMSDGCRARRICPIGQGNRLPDQAAFHMQAFL